MDNILMLSDSYKVSHYKQYPPKTETVYSYFESRGGKFPNIVFFGLQYYLKKYLEGVVVTTDKINEAQFFIDKHVGKGLFNRVGWEYILSEHGGKLPVIIKALPEGTKSVTHSVLMTIENTDPKCYWLTNYLETLLVQVWYGCTVATQSMEIKKMIGEYLEKTGVHGKKLEQKKNKESCDFNEQTLNIPFLSFHYVLYKKIGDARV